MKKLFFTCILFLLAGFTLQAQDNCSFNVNTTPVSCLNGNDGKAEVVLTGSFPGNSAGCYAPQQPATKWSTACTSTYTSNTGDVNIAPNQQVCLSANNFTGNLQVTGGTLVISGSANPQNINLNTNGNPFTLVITGTAVFNNLNLLGNANLINYGSLTFNYSVGFNGQIENHGTILAKGDLSINAPLGQVTNYKDITVHGNFNNFNTAINGGNLMVNGTMQNNGGSGFVNLCQLTVNNELINSTLITNTGKIQVGNWTRINGGSTIKGDAGSLLKTLNLLVDGELEGIGATCAAVSVSAQTIINGSGKISGAIDLCDANGIETNTGTLQAPATNNCSCTSGSATYAWGNPLQNVSGSKATGLTAGTYLVTVTLPGCTASSKEFKIEAPEALTASVNITGNAVTAVVSGGSPRYTYTWSGASGGTITQIYSTSGNYSLTVTDSKGCIYSVPFSVTVPAIEGCNVTVETKNPTCAGLTDGSAVVKVNGVAIDPSLYGGSGNTPSTCQSPDLAPASATSNCTYNYSSNTGEVKVGPGQQICLTAANFTGGIQVTGGTLVISREATPAYLNLNNDGAPFTLIITGKATFNSLNLDGNSTLKNYGTLIYNNSVGFNGTFENHGHLIVNGDFSINASTGHFTNKKLVEVHANFNNYNVTTNYSELKVDGNLHNNGGSGFINYCTITIGNELINSTFFTNY